MKLRSMFAFLLAAVLAAGMLPVPGRALETEPFEDVKETSWYAPYVMALHRQHVIEGMDGTHFGPSQPLTRAQLVTMLTPELGEEAMELYKNRKRFSDVAPGAWYAPYVNWASEQGWVSGYEDGTFRPDRPLTRAEASVILIAYCTKTENPILSGRLPELEEPKDEKEIPGWAADAVHKSLRAGLFRGYPDGTFGPGRTITRAEIAAVLCRVFDLDVNGSEETPEEPEEPVTADGITTQSYPVLGTTVNIVSFHPEDGFEADVILANDQLYSSEAASSMVKRSGAAVAVNGTYFNNSDLGVLSSFVRDGKVLRIENAHSQYKPYFVVDSEGNCSFQNMKILQTAVLSRDGTAVPEAVLEEVGCNYNVAVTDGSRIVFTKEFGNTSRGITPRMIMHTAMPLGLGLESTGEYVDIEIGSPVSTDHALSQLRLLMPEGLEILDFRQIGEAVPEGGGTAKKPEKAMSVVAAAEYAVRFRDSFAAQEKAGAGAARGGDSAFLPENWKEILLAFTSQDQILWTKETKKGFRTLDMKPLVYDFSIGADDTIFMCLCSRVGENLRPEQLIGEAFRRSGYILPEDALQIRRLDLLAERSGRESGGSGSARDGSDELQEGLFAEPAGNGPSEDIGPEFLRKRFISLGEM